MHFANPWKNIMSQVKSNSRKRWKSYRTYQEIQKQMKTLKSNSYWM